MSEDSRTLGWRSPRIVIAALCGATALLLLLARSAIFGSDEVGRSDFNAKAYAALIWGFALFASYWLVLGSESFGRRFVGQASSASLAYVRIVCTGILLLSTLWEDLASLTLIPLAAAQPMGILKFFYRLPGFVDLVRDAGFLRALEGGTALLLLLGVLGLKTRFVLPLATLGYLLLAGLLRQYSWFYHTGLLPLWILFVLCFTPCGDALSLDARARRRRGEPAPAASEVYAWSRYACWAVLAAGYLNAGVSKILLGGTQWLSPNNLKTNIIGDSLRVMEFDWGIGPLLVDLPGIFFSLLAGVTLVVEIGYAAVLFSRRARLIFPILMAGMHIGILFLQNIFFFDLILLQFIFLTDRALMRGLQRLGVESLPAAVRPDAGEPLTPRSAATATSPPFLSALTALILATFLAACTQHLKYFPISAIAIYANVNLHPVVRYVEITGITASGERREIRLETEIGALADGRSKHYLRFAFSKARWQTRVLNRVLETWADLHNVNLAAEDRIVKFVITRKSWDFERTPHHPQHGEVEERYAYKLKPRP